MFSNVYVYYYPQCHNVFSVNTVKERHSSIKHERNKARRKLKKYEKLEFTLSCSQDDEFVKTVATITERCPSELNSLLSEADARCKGQVLRKIWKHDVEDRLMFLKDQKRNSKQAVLHLTTATMSITGKLQQIFSLMHYRVW